MKKLFIFFCFVFLGLLTPTVTFAADACKGYQAGDNTHTQQTGICFYHILDSPYYTDNPTLECDDPIACHNTHFPDGVTCATMAQQTGRGSKYHAISDVVVTCGPNFGADLKCCAPDDQTTADSFPPPPCTPGKDPSTCASVNTALGTIQVDPGSLISNIFGVLLSISGGIAIVIIILSGYRIVFSQGDPEKLQNARQHLTSAIIGLLFIIFSVVILRVIGVDILHLPGLNP